MLDVLKLTVLAGLTGLQNKWGRLGTSQLQSFDFTAQEGGRI
jgi:hypothetical protein